MARCVDQYIDTPGTWTSEVERSLRVLDGAIAVFCAVGGWSPNPRQWRQADRYGVPRIAFVNKMDRWVLTLQRSSMMRTGSHQCGSVQIPIGSEDTFRGVVDLVEMRPSSRMTHKVT